MNGYALLMGLGGMLAVWRVVKTVIPRLAARWALAALLVLGGALIGARIGFVLWQPYSFDSLWDVLRLDQGGLVWFGAVPFAWLVIWLIAKHRSLPFGMVADRLGSMLPPLGVMTWLACWSAGCGYGMVLENADWLPLSVDERGLWATRLPLQWLAAVSLLLIFFMWETRFPKRRPGQRAAATWLIFSAHTLLFSFLRADPRPIRQGLAWDEWAALGYAITALFTFLWAIWPRNRVERSSA